MNYRAYLREGGGGLISEIISGGDGSGSERRLKVTTQEQEAASSAHMLNNSPLSFQSPISFFFPCPGFLPVLHLVAPPPNEYHTSQTVGKSHCPALFWMRLQQMSLPVWFQVRARHS